MTGTVNKLAVGRANTVLLVEDTAVITSLSARAVEPETQARLYFKGPGLFEERVKAHLSEVVLAVVDRIVLGLGLGLKSYELSLTNLGAASLAGREINISGYSADVPVFLALLSAGLGLALPQNVVSTGHIASSEGDIRMVEGLETKLEAARRDESIDIFIHPSLETDGSIPALMPERKARLEGALSQAKTDLRLLVVQDISDLLKKVVSDEQLVPAALANRLSSIVVLRIKSLIPGSPVGSGPVFSS